MEEMRAILDSLMGSDRNSVAALERPSRVTFKSPNVCHFYLLDFCPHDLFPNTKSDLGPCPNKHSDALREQFISDSEHAYYKRRYEREFMDQLQRLVDNVEQRIKRGNERILGPDESRLEQDKRRKMDLLKQEMAQLMQQAQEAGEKGNIAEAEAFTRKMTEVRCSLDRLNSTPTHFLASLSAQEKSLRVCPVCGAMQSLGDAASRFESHVSGKQHVGYERIRSTLATLKEKYCPGSSSGQGHAGLNRNAPVDGHPPLPTGPEPAGSSSPRSDTKATRDVTEDDALHSERAQPAETMKNVPPPDGKPFHPLSRDKRGDVSRSHEGRGYDVRGPPSGARHQRHRYSRDSSDDAVDSRPPGPRGYEERRESHQWAGDHGAHHRHHHHHHQQRQRQEPYRRRLSRSPSRRGRNDEGDYPYSARNDDYSRERRTSRRRSGSRDSNRYRHDNDRRKHRHHNRRTSLSRSLSSDRRRQAAPSMGSPPRGAGRPAYYDRPGGGDREPQRNGYRSSGRRGSDDTQREERRSRSRSHQSDHGEPNISLDSAVFSPPFVYTFSTASQQESGSRGGVTSPARDDGRRGLSPAKADRNQAVVEAPLPPSSPRNGTASSVSYLEPTPALPISPSPPSCGTEPSSPQVGEKVASTTAPHQANATSADILRLFNNNDDNGSFF